MLVKIHACHELSAYVKLSVSVMFLLYFLSPVLTLHISQSSLLGPYFLQVKVKLCPTWGSSIGNIKNEHRHNE